MNSANKRQVSQQSFFGRLIHGRAASESSRDGHANHLRQTVLDRASSTMNALGFDKASEAQKTLERLEVRRAEGGNCFRDAMAYGIASILQVEE